jgi:hypothetical protein
MSNSFFKYGLLACLLFVTSALWAADKKKAPQKKIPLYQGTHLGIELLQPTYSLISKQSGISGKIDINLRNTYFPTLEIGTANLVRTSEIGMQAASKGYFAKIGLNKSLAFLGDHAENVFFAGIHYGFSSYSYNLTSPAWNDSYWGSYPTNAFLNQSGNAGWYELNVGVRVKIAGPFSLGWTCQYKSTLHLSNNELGLPALIPGYGEYVKPQLGIAAYLYYKLPF